jgi:stage II sporulation protein D
VAFAAAALGTTALGNGRPSDSSIRSEDQVTPIRDVRVLVASDASRVRIGADDQLSMTRDDPGTPETTASLLDATKIELVEDPEGRVRVVAGQHPLPPWSRGGSATGLIVSSSTNGAVELSVRDREGWSKRRRYPGRMRITGSEGGGLTVINLVDLEAYVGCVVAGEVWPTFHTEAFRAQAIVSRTFVLFHMIERDNAGYDVKATQDSQVYKGIRTDEPGRRARDAARYTRGVVLAWRDPTRAGSTDRLFCTYYSAACGGCSQSASIFGPSNDIPPLAGNVRCDYCKIAPGKTYRWGPVRMTKSEVRTRLVASYPDLASLGQIDRVTVAERTASGRPSTVRIVGSSKDTYDMLAERFRLALGGMRVRSTDFELRNTKDKLIFEDGRGFGHGLGLCQWGMQGQALAGKKAGAILRYYYPGAQIMRAY